jgi:hypothetical protein
MFIKSKIKIKKIKYLRPWSGTKRKEEKTNTEGKSKNLSG